MNIVNAIKEGDQLVFQQVFNQYHSKLYFYIFNKTGSAYVAEEVVQITFTKLWDRRQQLNDEFTISTQLFRIATTSLIDLLRKYNTQNIVLKEVAPLLPASVNDSTYRVQEKQLQQSLAAAMDALPPVRRKVFEMSRVMGLSYKEIAENLSISTKTVEIHISKSLKQLRKQLSGWISVFILFIYFNYCL